MAGANASLDKAVEKGAVVVGRLRVPEERQAVQQRNLDVLVWRRRRSIAARQQLERCGVRRVAPSVSVAPLVSKLRAVDLDDETSLRCRECLRVIRDCDDLNAAKEASIQGEHLCARKRRAIKRRRVCVRARRAKSGAE